MRQNAVGVETETAVQGAKTTAEKAAETRAVTVVVKNVEMSAVTVAAKNAEMNAVTAAAKRAATAAATARRATERAAVTVRTGGMMGLPGTPLLHHLQMPLGTEGCSRLPLMI